MILILNHPTSKFNLACDGNHKMNCWNLVIHAGIDSYLIQWFILIVQKCNCLQIHCS